MDTNSPATGEKPLPSREPAEFRLDGSPLALDQLDSAIGRPLRVELDGRLWQRIEGSAKSVASIAAGNEPAYGINTGFGSLCRKRIAPDQVRALQVHLIESHAVGVGPPAPPEVVRFMMLLKIHALTHGLSGIRGPTVECLAGMLNADILPVIPTQGSLGASGDLAPLAHMVLPMLGQGQVTIDGRLHAAADAFTARKLKAIELGPKEGLALINGTQFMSAYAVIIAARARRLVRHADLIAAMSLEGIKGSIRPFDERLHAARPHPGAITVAANIRRLMADSEILASHARCDRVQDPYSIRCVPQVHGAVRDSLSHAMEVIEREINSVTDNPLIFDNGEVISGGLFHGEPLALVLDYAAMALAELASISERRIYLLLSGIEGLPVLLMQDTGINSGFMMPQYTAAALVSENKGLCTPSCVDSIPTSLGQEDHVSMGARSAVKCLQVLENSETVLAIEMMCAAQAMDYRAPLRPGVGPRLAQEEVRRHIVHAEMDRTFGEDIRASLALLRSQGVLRAAQDTVGDLA